MAQRAAIISHPIDIQCRATVATSCLNSVEPLWALFCVIRKHEDHLLSAEVSAEIVGEPFFKNALVLSVSR